VGVGETTRAMVVRGAAHARWWTTARELVAREVTTIPSEGKTLKGEAQERLRHEIGPWSSSLLETAVRLRKPESGTGVGLTIRPMWG
jgi:hypothetical protein